MDSSESISFSMDTTTDSIDVRNHFHSNAAKAGTTNRDNARQSPRKHARMLLREHNNETFNADADDDHDHEVLIHKRPPDKVIVVDETPPPSTASSASSSSSSSSSSLSQSQSTIATSSTHGDCPIASMSQPIIYHSEETIKEEISQSASAATTPTKSKKSVLFNNVTVYHFNRSQGFNSIPTLGGSTLGMKRKHFLRRRLSVDMYEEVRRRSRRDILLKIRAEKRRKDEERRLEQQRQLNERLKMEGNSTSSVSNTITSDSDDNERMDENLDDDDDDDEYYSDFSDISDSDLEGDNKVFLPAINAKVRRSLLRACGVLRIDPNERRECKKIRDSRTKAGCRCVGSCLPQYCECIRLGVNCYVDRQNFPCGCVANGCRNPEGRAEFDRKRVKDHFRDKVLSLDALISETSSDFADTEQSQSPPPVVSEEIC